MNNDTTYALLVRSEEKGRSIMETAVYALLGLSAILSILQFIQQPERSITLFLISANISKLIAETQSISIPYAVWVINMPSD